MKINIGVSEKNCKKVAEALIGVLANAYILYLKTQNFHWNVTGPHFPEYHALFEKQYEDLADAVDEVAERIRALGHHTPASFTQFLQHGKIKEATGTSSAKEMLQQLLADHETVIQQIHQVMKDIDDTNDEGSLDLLAGRLRVHEKHAWMLRSSLA